MNTTPERKLLTRPGCALLLALTLAGCASWGKKDVEYVPYEVQVPVEVGCVADLPPEPAPWATEALRKADSLDDKVKALLAEREQRIGFEKKLKAATDGCR